MELIAALLIEHRPLAQGFLHGLGAPQVAGEVPGPVDFACAALFTGQADCPPTTSGIDSKGAAARSGKGAGNRPQQSGSPLHRQPTVRLAEPSHHQATYRAPPALLPRCPASRQIPSADSPGAQEKAL